MGTYVTLWIWYEDYFFVVCDAVYFGTYAPRFRRYLYIVRAHLMRKNALSQ